MYREWKAVSCKCGLTGCTSKMIDGLYGSDGRYGADDAHLIAAAPDLYAACKAALGSMESGMNEPVRVALKAALAKAEGRQP